MILKYQCLQYARTASFINFFFYPQLHARNPKVISYFSDLSTGNSITQSFLESKELETSDFERDLFSLSQFGEVYQKRLTKIYQMTILFITLLLRGTLFSPIYLQSVI